MADLDKTVEDYYRRRDMYMKEKTGLIPKRKKLNDD